MNSLLFYIINLFIYLVIYICLKTNFSLKSFQFIGYFINFWNLKIRYFFLKKLMFLKFYKFLTWQTFFTKQLIR